MTDSQKLDYLIERFDGMQDDITEMKGEIAGMKVDIAGMQDDITEMKGEIAGMKVDIAGMQDDIAGMKDDIHDLQDRMEKQENEIRYIRVFQENNLEKGIKMIAEGHIELRRKLNEALKITEDDEMLHLRVNVLECDMFRIKEKLNIV